MPRGARRCVAALGAAGLAGCASARAPAPPDAAPAAQPAPRDPRAVQPERPTVATHAGTVAPGYAELETGVERDRPGDGTTLVSVPTTLKLGLAPRAQLTAQLPVLGGSGVSAGLGDVSLGVKWRVAEDHPWLQDVAVLPSLKLATGGARGTGTTDVGLLLIDSRTLGPASLDLNVGLTRRSGDGSRAPRSATLWTGALGIPLRDPVGWQLELYGYPGTAGPAGQRPIVAILGGPTLAVRSTLALDAGVIVPVAGPQAHAVYAGLVTNLGTLVRR
jgi:hypothetical protein